MIYSFVLPFGVQLVSHSKLELFWIWRHKTSPPPMYANLSHTETQHAMPASDITVEHGESDHTQGTDQVYHNSDLVL